MTLLFGAYEPTGLPRELRLVCTGQTLRLRAESNDEFQFEYADESVSVPFVARRHQDGTNRGVAISVDFNVAGPAVATSYGLWRRVSFFLLDSLAAWACTSVAEPGRLWYVRLIGGWRNARWEPSSILEHARLNSTSLPHSNHNDDSHRPFPLEHKPSPWVYVDGEGGIRDFALDTWVRDDGPRILGDASIDAQLKTIPHFRRQDGKSFLFHRYIAANMHRGEDYSPLPHYGYVNENCAFTFRASLPYGVDNYSDPILVRNVIRAADHFKIPSLRLRVNPVYLAPALREELIFALIDVDAVRMEATKRFPVMLERDREMLSDYAKRYPNHAPHWNGITFSSYLSQMSGSPISKGLGLTSLAFRHTYGGGLPSAIAAQKGRSAP